jgi:hypothetical protein
MFLFGGHF